ncbi:hypothetical protein GGR54DRAFT_215693 [Hypoxylon sp. NC1633]|nr:hypothetical protein GGR54DRAFT_215693 [Hypoxylon sp. NC1633]
MQLTSIFVAAGLAAFTTNALLLPPEISDADNDIVSTLPVPIPAAESHPDIPKFAEAQTLKIKCPGCPLRIPHHGSSKVVTDVPSHLVLDFSIRASDDGDRLMLNEFELYPNADPFRGVLSAAVRPSRFLRRPHQYKGPLETMQTLGFGMQSRPVVTSEDDALELVMVELDIIEVGNVFVDGIPDIQIKLVKTPSGKLMIGEIETVEMQKNPMDKQEECTTLLCKWRSIIMQKLASLRAHKGCGGRPAHAKGHVQDKVDDGHRHSNPSWGAHHGQHQKNWGLLLKNIASHILLPVAIGILAGVAASILGMLVGTFVVFLWRAVVRGGNARRHRRHGHHHKASHVEVAVDEEKSGLMVHKDEVDAPPAYIEEGVVVLDDKKAENVA